MSANKPESLDSTFRREFHFDTARAGLPSWIPSAVHNGFIDGRPNLLVLIEGNLYIQGCHVFLEIFDFLRSAKTGLD